MRKILIGLLMFGSVSNFANTSKKGKCVGVAPNNTILTRLILDGETHALPIFKQGTYDQPYLKIELTKNNPVRKIMVKSAGDGYTNLFGGFCQRPLDITLTVNIDGSIKMVDHANELEEEVFLDPKGDFHSFQTLRRSLNEYMCADIEDDLYVNFNDKGCDSKRNLHL